jgi:hypothetical protein
MRYPATYAVVESSVTMLDKFAVQADEKLEI